MGGGQDLVCRFVSLIFFFPCFSSISTLLSASCTACGTETWPSLWWWLQEGWGRGGQLAQQLLFGDKRRLFFAATVTAASQNSKSARLGTNPASLRVAEGWYVGG